MKDAPEIKLFTLPEWTIILGVLLSIGGYFVYPIVYQQTQGDVSPPLQKELDDTKKNLVKAEEEIIRLISIQPQSPNDALQKKVWDWEDYAKKASAYQDYLEGKADAPKVERPHFPYTLLP